MPCIEAVASSCIIVTWWIGAGGIQALSERPTGFLQCSDTVGLVIKNCPRYDLCVWWDVKPCSINIRVLSVHRVRQCIC